MAVSFHILLPFFIAFAVVDVALLSVRTLLSRQRHELVTLYALMAVEEAMLVFQLLLVLGQLLSTYMITAGMWSDIAALFAAFAPLWLLRVFFAAFTMVYKNTLIPRWTLAARLQVDAGAFDYTVRAWHAAGYGVVAVLDVVCCCVYYLAAVYVFGYLSDKTLYVPYHRRRWRHEQSARASAAAYPHGGTYALPVADASSGADTLGKASRRKRGRDTARVVAQQDLPLTALARTPSFAQWQQQGGNVLAPSTAAATAGPRCTPSVQAGSEKWNGLTDAARDGEGDGRPALQRASALPSFPSVSFSTAGGVAGGTGGGGERTVTFSHGTAFPVAPEAPSGGEGGRAATVPGKSGTRGPTRADGSSPPPPPHLQTPRSAPAPAFLSNLPPLQLSRRFTLTGAGTEGNLNQFAAALVEHGFGNTAQPQQQGPGRRASISGSEAMAADSQETASPLQGLAGTATPDFSRRGSNSNSDPSGTLVPGRLQHPNDPTLATAAAESAAAAAKDSGATSGSHSSSFRKMISAWRGGAKKSEGSLRHLNLDAEQLRQVPSPPLPPQQQQRQGQDFSTSPNPRRRSTSLVRFALDGSGSVSGRDGDDDRAASALGARLAQPSLPPRPRATFRIDHTTGNVVPVEPG